MPGAPTGNRAGTEQRDEWERQLTGVNSYAGDKLGVLKRVLKWLTPAGTFVADLDLASVRGDVNVRAWLRAADVGYDARRRRVTCTGPRDLDLPFRYLGADDKAGPNYTGQPAVNSYYENGLTPPIS